MTNYNSANTDGTEPSKSQSAPDLFSRESNEAPGTHLLPKFPFECIAGGIVKNSRPPVHQGAFSDRDVYATIFRAAANCARSHGLRFREAGTALLDWPAILERLHHEGMVLPGPSRGNVSFWYVTRAFEVAPYWTSRVLSEIVGPGWVDAALKAIRKGTLLGPSLGNRRLNPLQAKANWPTEGQTYPRLRFAFRPFDEPPAWRPKRVSSRSVRGTLPSKWSKIDWYVPSDLQERGRNFNHTEPMGDSPETNLQKALRRIASIVDGAVGDDLELILLDLDALDLTKRRFRFGPADQAIFNEKIADADQTIRRKLGRSLVAAVRGALRSITPSEGSSASLRSNAAARARAMVSLAESRVFPDDLEKALAEIGVFERMPEDDGPPPPPRVRR